jgi:predicted dehydrogenase
MSRVTRRDFLETTLATAALTALPVAPGLAAPVRRVGPNDRIRIAVIGCRGRGNAHVGAFKSSPDAEVVALCDPDTASVERAQRAVPGATYFKDLRELLASDGIDAVSIATPNHWHSLATIWALQAGKHVYVEKPISHTVHEGRIVVETARRKGLVVQHGTQARSQPATVEAMKWLHDGGLGKIHIARGLCYKRRQSIGRVEAPQTPPETLDYDLWTGPAALQPLTRRNLHYDWHWDFNTGNGDIGNQGVHQMDIARWGLGLDRLPARVMSFGGRFGYVDDANTPNSQIAVYDYGEQQIIFEVRGLKTPAYRTAHIGTIFHGEGGYLVSASYAKVIAYDNDGTEMKTFTGSGNHFQNFLDAVKANDPTAVNATALDGHLSAALGHLGNISYRMGHPYPIGAAGDTPFGRDEAARETLGRMQEHLGANGIDLASTEGLVGPSLPFDAESETFGGEHAGTANPMLTRPEREPFTVPRTV